MQNDWIFSTENCVEAIQKKIELEGDARGYKATLARSAQCQPAYLSQVLASKAMLTMDQASGLCDLWILSDLEAEYFLTLVELARASTQGLKRKLERKLSRLRNQSHLASGRLSPEPEKPEKALHYYLDWSIAAIHVLLTIPGYNEPKIIAKKLAIDENRAIKALSILSDLGIVAQKGMEWSLTARHLHAPHESLYVPLHHRNWRDKTKELILTDKFQSNLHYTSVHTLSKNDFEKIRDILRDTISKTHHMIRESKEEVIGGLAIDWFEI